jgi:riboflavin biosynthesis pyrimidine reductase
MSELKPLDTLYEVALGDAAPLPSALARLYGTLRWPAHPGRPHVYANFVETLDGVVALDSAGGSGGGEISGSNLHDQAVMGMLRAAADAVVVGAGTLRSVPSHLWTAEHIYPELTDEYRTLRESLNRSGPPLNVVITARGELDPRFRVLRSGEVPVLVVTTEEGARRLGKHSFPSAVRIAAVTSTGRIGARAVLDAIREARPSERILVEGGPHLLGDFLAESCLDELFLTLAPQVAGRAAEAGRLGLVEGRQLAPDEPRWAKLIGVRRGGSHLFLRYSLEQVS